MLYRYYFSVLLSIFNDCLSLCVFLFSISTAFTITIRIERSSIKSNHKYAHLPLSDHQFTDNGCFIFKQILKFVLI